jgi:hypothetical protein
MNFTKSVKTVRLIGLSLQCLAIAIAAHLSKSVCIAAVIYGGPTNAPAPGVEYRSPSPPYPPGSSAGNGAAIGNVQKWVGGISQSNVAVRWDTTGAPALELGYLGTTASYSRSIAYAINTAGTAVGAA